MSKKLFVGNLNWTATQDDLTALFSQFGQIDEAVVINDRATGRSKGFGFVTFQNDDDAAKAIEELNGKPFMDRDLVVNEARPMEPRN